MSKANDRAHFDAWAATYDADAQSSEEFPLAGHTQVLEAVVSAAAPSPSDTVLDLGTGTGSLAGLFHARGCPVWATDFSPEMIARGRAGHPGVEFAVGELREPPPRSFPERFACVTSAYAFHHLELREKVDLIETILADRLAEKGRLVVADVSFPTIAAREEARVRFANRWDETEMYWAADETRDALRSLPVLAAYTQVSFCAGVYSFRPRR